MWLYLEDNSITDRSAMETLKEGHKYLDISGDGGWGGVWCVVCGVVVVVVVILIS